MIRTTDCLIRLFVISALFLPKTAFAETLLMQAVKNNNLSHVERLLRESHQIDEISDEGETALHIALKNNYINIAELIINNEILQKVVDHA